MFVQRASVLLMLLMQVMLLLVTRARERTTASRDRLSSYVRIPFCRQGGGGWGVKRIHRVLCAAQTR